MILRIFICILIFFSVIGNIYSQDNDPIEQPDVFPISPSSFSLGKFGQIPVGLFTGTPNVSIPLYQIDVKEASIPISLGYSSNGIRVDEMPSITGLSWNLNSGGVVIRLLNDEPDECCRVPLASFPWASFEMNQFLHSVINNESFDSQPDIFSFNFLGYNGKFYLDSLMKPRLIEPSPLKIELLNSFGDAGLEGFDLKIIDDKGITFWFGGGSATEIVKTEPYGNGNQGTIHISLAENAWYLKKITLLNGEEVNFTYVSNWQNYDGGISQQATASRSIETNTNNGLPVNRHAVAGLPTLTRTSVKSSLLTKINWNQGEVQFQYDSLISEQPSGFKKLRKILILSKSGEVVKKYSLTYSEYNADESYVNPDDNGIYKNLNRKKVFLSRVDDSTQANNHLSYSFEYYYPDQMPPRLSYAQDYWGYFNGKHNNEFVPDDLSGYNDNSYNSPDFTSEEIKNLFLGTGGDRSTNPQFGIKGLLKKVTYPTGGYTSFEYEPHTYQTEEFHLPNTKKRIDLNVNSDENGFATTVAKDTTDVIPFTQSRIPIYFSVISVHNNNGCDSTTNPWYGRTPMTVIIRDIFSNSNISIEVYSPNSGVFVSYPTPYTVPNGVIDNYYVTLQKDRAYEIKIYIQDPCTSGALSLSYYNEPGQNVIVNKSVGGLRIKKKIDYSDNTNNIKRYYYGDLDCLDCSSGKLENFKPALSFFYSSSVWTEYIGNIPIIKEKQVNKVTLGSSSLNTSFNSQGYHISYSDVIESFGEDINNGVIHHKYNIIFDSPPYQHGDPIVGSLYSNEFGNGQELSRSTYRYNNTLELIEEEQYKYLIDDRLNSEIQGYIASLAGTSSASGYIANTYNLNTYKLRSKWSYLSEKVIKKIIPALSDTIIQTESYTYNNPTHCQITDFRAYSSEGKTLLTKYYYPDDLPYEPYTNLLINQNRVSIPIIIEKFVDSSPVYSKKILFKKFSETLILENQHLYSFCEEAPELRVQFNNYDNKGNLLDYLSSSDELHKCIIWGYNQSNPISKVINSNYGESGYTGFEYNETNGWNMNNSNSFETHESFTGNYSMNVNNGFGPGRDFPVGNGADKHSGYQASVWVKGPKEAYLHIEANSYTIHQTVQNEEGPGGWRLLKVVLYKHQYESLIDSNFKIRVYVGNKSGDPAYFDDLRFHPLDAQMTTYTYEPLIGITSESDPNNKPTRYEYDGFGRLIHIRDFQDNIIKKYDYHYKQ